MWYEDAEFNAALEEAYKSTTYEGLVASYAGLQQHLAETVPAVPLAQTYQWCIGTKNFGGVDLGTQTYEVCFTNAYVVE